MNKTVAHVILNSFSFHCIKKKKNVQNLGCNLVTLQFKDQFSLLASYISILLAHWLFISTYKTHILHDNNLDSLILHNT